jgi:hypothetical protein
VNLEETGQLVGSHRWWELAGFELLGGWAHRVADPAAKVLLDRHSRHCAWRAGQWQERLPVMSGTVQEVLVRPAQDREAAAVNAMRNLGGGGDGRDPDEVFLAAAYRVVLARLAAAYQGHLEVASPVADASVRRTLLQASTDVAADWAEGEARLQALLTGEEVVGIAAGCVAGLESILAGDGPPRDAASEHGRGGGRESNPPDGDHPSHPL